MRWDKDLGFKFIGWIGYLLNKMFILKFKYGNDYGDLGIEFLDGYIYC